MKSIVIYYDGDCPFCAKYVSLLKLKETVTSVTLHNLRTDETARNEFLEKGYNPDKGMLVVYNGSCTYGADAMNTLALLSTPNSFVNKISAKLLSNSVVASFLYPIFRTIRWLALFFSGHQTFEEADQRDESRATLFGILFSLFSLFHFFNYAFEYGRLPPQIDQISILISAVLLLFHPGSSRLLFLLVLASSISTVVQAPVDSNHTMVRTMWLLGYWLSFAWCMFKAKPYVTIFSTSAIAGQGALLVMYFFGIFHKINAGFLDPISSCAVALWEKMPAPLNNLDHPAMNYIAIYGTFVVEGLLIAILLTKKYRHIGIVLGILFHLLLSLSGYAMYISFTTLAIALHCLFLSGEAANLIVGSPEIKNMTAKLKQKLYLSLGLAVMISIGLLSYWRMYTQVSIAALIFVLPFCYLIIKYGKSKTYEEYTNSSKVIGAVITVLFFINCSLPYFGLKSAQTVNMFANIRLEGGVSNHLIFTNPKHHFEYLNDVVIITSLHGSSNPGLVVNNDFAEAYYDVLAALDNDPELRISYRRNGLLFEHQSKFDLQDDIDSTLHPRWVRKWFHFKPVSISTPEKCTV